MMTIHVAICDDSDADAQYVRSLTASWAAAWQLEPEIDVFPSAERFLTRYERRVTSIFCC